MNPFINWYKNRAFLVLDSSTPLRGVCDITAKETDVCLFIEEDENENIIARWVIDYKFVDGIVNDDWSSLAYGNNLMEEEFVELLKGNSSS